MTETSEKAGRGDRATPTVKVLVIEDEKKIASLIRKGLEAQGFVVDVCLRGDEGYTLATTRPYDVLVLDIMLPGRDGLSILRGLRDRKNAVPVILVTARSEMNERIEGLNLGADDYIVKPFFVDELLARVQAVLRRTAGDPLSVLRAGELTVSLIDRTVRRGEQEVLLPPREFTLLAFLMRSPGRVFTRVQLLEHVWGFGFDPQTNLVEVCVGRLRAKIDEPDAPSLIESVRGVGYRFKKTEGA